jgi:hypothetical protein
MEIREIIDYRINHLSENIEIDFRTIDDEDLIIRKDSILFSDLDSFGFGSLKTSIIDESLNDDEDDEFDIFGFGGYYDDEELLSFLNEYYLIYPERLPEKDFK